MDSVSPDQCGGQQNTQAHSLLAGSHNGILAMSSGGCARYVFSTDARYCLDRRGYPLINYTSVNPHHHLIMTNSTMDLRLVDRMDQDGNELSLLILTGMLQLVDPGDHDSIDRYARYYDCPTENYSRGASRLYRMIPDKACFELISGQRLPLNLDAIIKRLIFTEKEELQLIAFGNQCLKCQKNMRFPMRVAGIDSFGADVRMNDVIMRWTFPTPLLTAREVELALTGISNPEPTTS